MNETLLRKANSSDIEFLWYLRNQPETYRYSRQNQTVNWKEHIEWILPIILKINNKELFIIKNLETSIGQVRLDWMESKKAEISISILKEFQGKGFANKSLSLAIKQAKKEDRAKSLMAVIHEENLTSQKLFERLNFKLKEKKEIWLKYVLEL